MSRTPPPRTSPLTAGTTVAPGYEVLAHLCRTGWLDLYDAWSQERECRCVVKVLRPDRQGEQRLRERLLQEGHWLQTFTHPHLVRAYETGETPEPHVVLETLTGESLAHLVDRRRRRLATDDLALLGLHLCSALHYLHGKGLLHLDIKPSNIVVGCRRAKVLDLSIARPPGLAPPGLGTFCYLAPEQARGGMLTPATDVWGLGSTLYEAATGAVPFDDTDTHTATDSGTGSGTGSGTDADTDRYPQLDERAPSVTTRRRLPHTLAAAIDSCLSPDPGARPSLAQLAAVLDGVLPHGRRGVPAQASPTIMNHSPGSLRTPDTEHRDQKQTRTPDTDTRRLREVPMPSRPAEAWLRGVAAVCALLSAVAHLLIVPEHLKEMPYMGILFLIGSAALLVAAGGLARRNPVPAWLLGTLVSGGMLLGFALSRTVGLPNYQEAGWDPPYGVLCMVAEVAFIITFVAWCGVAKTRTPPAEVTRPTTSVHAR
ncbi:serine/threonine-protein kinase [Streptomyces lydicus]|uniref:serine/threonine-protein kinase n=1 Tax=Streptomyces lydicus TaxID=47763 RepID=UPI0038073A7F